MKELFLLAAVICFGMAILKFYSARMGRSSPAPQTGGGNSVLTAGEAKERLEANPDAILLDVRTQEEYDGAISPARCASPTRTSCRSSRCPLRRTRKFWSTAAPDAAAQKRRRS